MLSVEKRAPVVNVARCTGCELCVSLCPQHSLEMVDGKSALVRPGDCRGEGLCADVCNVGAIEIVWIAVRARRNVRNR